MDNILDYAKGIINETVLFNGINYPITAYPDLYPEQGEDGDELDFTGISKVLVISPIGTDFFTLEQGGEIEDPTEKKQFSVLPEEFQKAVLAAVEKLTPR